MKRALIVTAIYLAVGPAVADDMVARHGADSVRITPAACPEKIAEKIPQEQRADFRHAVTVLGGKTFQACWMFQGGLVVLKYEDGDMGIVPVTAFEASPGV